MYSFAAFSWNSKDSSRATLAQLLAHRLLSAATDWQSVLDVPGLRVFHRRQPGGACHAYVLERESGVILGRLFHAGSDEDRVPSDPMFDDRESSLVVESKGRRLVERYWGHYVAFLCALDGERRFVLRDPTGGLPCFLTTTAGVDVILSDIEDCVRLHLAPFSIDWDHLTAFFKHGRLITRTTGFKEVTQLYAGECVALKDDAAMTRSFYWNPVDVYQANAIENPDEARGALRAVIRHCVSAWASCYDSIVHELSGGLDSSIVVGCLIKARPRPAILCFHYFTEMSEGDERLYAREAAHSAACDLIESEVRVSERTLESQLNPAKVATPAVLCFLSAPELLKRRLVTERRAGAVFSGQGGDQLFQETKTKLIAAEYAHRHGLSPRLLNVIGMTSRLTHESIWSVLAAVIGYGLLGRSFDPYAVYETPSIFSDDVRSSLSRVSYAHPWVENATRLPASKINHVFNVVDCQPFYQRPQPNAELIHPLISQPIIELCLQIPGYILAHNGRARGLVREAFEGDVPEKIIRRYSKGGTTSYFNRILVKNAAFLRELLLDGVLVREGMLDRCALTKQLSERELLIGNGLRPILNAARAETWLSAWTDVRQRTAA